MIDESLHVVATAGSDPLTVVVHGAMDRHNSFRRLARRLEGQRIAVYDRRGYGRSERAGATCDFAKHVADLMDILDGQRAVVVGHSMGGLVALHAAAVFPSRVLAVGAFEPPAPWLPWWPDTWVPRPTDSDEQVVRDFHERIIGPGSWERIASHLQSQYVQEGHALRNDLTVGYDGPLFDAVDVTVPVVIGHGTESTADHIRAARYFVDQLADAELHVIDGARHGAHRSHADAFARFVCRTIERAER